jgi:hypothetical protein
VTLAIRASGLPILYPLLHLVVFTIHCASTCGTVL